MDEPDYYQISPTRRLYRPAVIEAIRTQAYESKKRLKKHGLDATVYLDPQKTELLFVKTAGEWMKQEYGKPMPRMLLGDLWLEGEMCILFADTNLGKSILAVQIGNNLAQGGCTLNFNNSLELQTRVLYVDFEMGSKQFESRYFDSQWGSFPFGESNTTKTLLTYNTLYGYRFTTHRITNHYLMQTNYKSYDLNIQNDLE
ncbi:hypothetical protein ACVW0P_000864 [Mucilaginibacter sp. UYNi724]